MSTNSISKFLREAPWQLWMAQIRAVVRIELRRSLWMRRSIWIYLLAFGPVFIIALYALLNRPRIGLDGDTRLLAWIFQFFYLRFGIFFGCLGLFTWLFKGDVIEKSLHYYFLAPMRREVLVA